MSGACRKAIFGHAVSCPTLVLFSDWIFFFFFFMLVLFALPLSAFTESPLPLFSHFVSFFMFPRKPYGVSFLYAAAAGLTGTILTGRRGDRGRVSIGRPGKAYPKSVGIITTFPSLRLSLSLIQSFNTFHFFKLRIFNARGIVVMFNGRRRSSSMAHREKKKKKTTEKKGKKRKKKVLYPWTRAAPFIYKGKVCGGAVKTQPPNIFFFHEEKRARRKRKRKKKTKGFCGPTFFLRVLLSESIFFF